MRLPSGLNVAEFTGFSWPRRTLTLFPEAASQTRAVASSEAVTMYLPSRLKATELTLPVWPRSSLRQCFNAPSQTRATLSSWYAVAMRLPSGLNATEATPTDPTPKNAAPTRVANVDGPRPFSETAARFCPDAASHSRTVPSAEAVTMRLLSGLNAAEPTQK